MFNTAVISYAVQNQTTLTTYSYAVLNIKTSKSAITDNLRNLK